MPVRIPIAIPGAILVAVPVAISRCLLALACALLPGLAAAVDANLASQAELQSVRGIGPAIAARIVAERERGPYVDLDDLRDRVRGVGAATLRRMAESGLEVGRPQGMAGGAGAVEVGAADEPGAGKAGRAGGRARGWVRELPGGSAQPRRPSSPGMTGW